MHRYSSVCVFVYVHMHVYLYNITIYMDILYTYDYIWIHTHHYKLGSQSCNWLQSGRPVQAREASYWIEGSQDVYNIDYILVVLFTAT